MMNTSTSSGRFLGLPSSGTTGDTVHDESPVHRGQQRDRGRGDDRGFMMALFGLLLIPIVIFTALAVDVSSWYSRATELQRTADAASLAGVVWMPNVLKANTESETVLVRNGMATGSTDLTVTKSVGDQPNSYKVCVTDENVTQFFGVVFASPTKMTRCATAMYDLPLQIGSPLNFVGGYDNNFEDVGGQPYIPPTPAVPPYQGSSPPDNDYTIRPTNYNTVLSNPGNVREGCKWVHNPNGHSTNNGRVYGYWWDASGNRRNRITNQNRLDNDGWIWRVRSGGSWNYYYADDLADCEWDIPGTPFDPGQPYIAPFKLIRPEMNPRFWLAVEAPGTDAVQGDRYSPYCYGKGYFSGDRWNGPDTTCPTSGGTARPNPDHRASGYYYTLNVRESNPYIHVQVFDASHSNRGSNQLETGDTQWDSSTWYTNFEILAPDATPFDPTDNPVVNSGTCGGSAGNQDNSGSWSLESNDSTATNYFKNQWRTLCTLTSPVPTTNNSPYIVRVWSSSTGGRGNASNQFALRAVASNTTALDPSNYPVDAQALSSQPSFAAWQHMAINVNIETAGLASFFLAEVTPNYAGKILVLELYDSAEGATSLTVNNPDGVQQGCVWTSSKLANVTGGGAASGNTIGPGGDGMTSGNCTVLTGGSTNNGRLLTIKMPIPLDYTCDDTYRPAAVDTSGWNNGCWWSITYNVDNAHDNTTWGAHIEGDPVRLVE